jgi:undecaprenyl diphosphate synthase
MNIASYQGWHRGAQRHSTAPSGANSGWHDAGPSWYALDVSTTNERTLPRHIGFIMDGNGRWAQARGLPRIEGHRVGSDSVRDIVRASRQLGLEAITLYAFSSQNWSRPADEVSGLMDLLREFLVSERSEILDNEIRLKAIGDAERLPPLVKAPLDELCAASAHHRKMTLTLALSYGGRESIASAVAHVATDVAAGRLSAAEIDAERFGTYLPTADLPPLDLVIRTSGEQRVSNFLLWEIAYAELMFVDIAWPDFRRAQLYRCLETFGSRERRFGLTSAQIVDEDV